MREIVLTKGIKEKLDMPFLKKIIEILANKEKRVAEKDIDYLQIFEARENKLINRQEFPYNEKEYEVPLLSKLKKVFAIKQDDAGKRCWVIMCPEEM